VAVALTLPAESILLKAVSTSSQTEAATAWVADLSASEIRAAARKVQEYPLAYRRAILRELTAQERSDVWRAHIGAYITAHPELSAEAVAALQAAGDAASPEALSAPTAASRGHIAVVAAEVERLLGREAAEYLLYRLGPKDGQFASREPITDKLASYVRQAFVAMAFAEECDCAADFGCSTSLICKTNLGCTPDTDWPACGWFWNDTCDGLCRPGFAG
jgi:hypothetical protein